MKKSKTYDQLTSAEKFNLIAPLVIYLSQDCRSESKRLASNACARLIKINCPLFHDGITRQDVMAGCAPKGLYRAYNHLVESIVMDERPQWHSFIDKYGSPGFKDECGEVVFTGDECGMHLYFRDAESVFDRISLQDKITMKM